LCLFFERSFIRHFQNDLAYDVSMYQRDRGETDWDARSIASTNSLGDGMSTIGPSKSVFYANGRSSPAPPVPGYDRYMARGPGGSGKDEYELTRFDSTTALPHTDEQPLLAHTQQLGYADPVALASRPTLPSYPSASRVDLDNGIREAPLHRPYLSREMSNYSNASSPGGYSPAEENMAGRGAFRK
jgi:calcium permeable stress-gated cation channel